MITPDYLDEVVKGTEDVVSAVNEYILKRVTRRIAATFENGEGNLFIPSTKADLRLLRNSGMLVEDIEKELQKRLPDISAEIHYAFMQSAGEISRQNMDVAGMIVETEGLNVQVPDVEIPAIILKSAQLHMTPAELRILENAYRRTLGEMHNLTKTMAKCASESYIMACDNAFMRVQTGVPISEAIIDAIKEASDRGVEVVTYGNKKTEAAAAIARAVRTGVNQANGEIVLQRCAEMGVEYVKASEHLGARVTDKNDFSNHSWWQGKVYKLDWNNARLREYANNAGDSYAWLQEMKKELSTHHLYDYPDFVETCGLGDIRGIMGANCRHSFYPFYPGINIDRGQQIDPEENKKRYELTRKQRAMERAIRATKREIAGFDGSGLSLDEIKERKRKLRMKLKEQSDKYMDFCKDNGLKPRNFSLKI